MGEAESCASSRAPGVGRAVVALLGPRCGTMVVQRLPVRFHEVRRRGGACLFGDSDRRRVFSFCLAVLVLVSVTAMRGGCTGGGG